MFNNENPKENHQEDDFLDSHNELDCSAFSDEAKEEVEFSLDFFEQHGLVLASLEALRLENINDNPVSAWSISVIEELVAVAKKDKILAKVFHNILAKRLI